MKTLAEQFQASMGQPVRVGDKDVLPIFTELITNKTLINLRWIETNSSVKQGVQIKLDKGSMDINGEKLSNVVLWEDTSPTEVSLLCTPKKSSKLKIWNVWEIDGVVQAWVGNSGMHIENEDSKTVLNCSDGLGDSSFNNVRVEISLTD
ncbi:TPA: hypothetical protein P0E06_001809 [Vibrio fluvialis clinical-1]|nr:hypothetical protein [Vibrio fluvialis]HDM8034406.1 hypothetical protein [Vibrio fluvialis clinical-1]